MREGRLTGALSVTELNGGGHGLVMTCLAAGAWQERVTLHGEGLTVEVSAFRELRVKYPDHEEVFGLDRPGRWMSESAERGFNGEIEHFFECVRQRQQPQTDGYDAARTQELMEAMVACAR
jgi:virulence factor